MLRLIFVVSILVIGALLSLTDSLYALLLYLWWAYFRPDYWVFTTTLHDLPISFVIGTFLLIRATLGGEVPIRFDARTIALGSILVLSTVSTFNSDFLSFSRLYWWDFARSLVITYLLAVLPTNVKRLRLIILGIALSLGFEATKQGWLQLVLNPGAVNQNDVAFLGDNNLVAVGMLMLACLTVALARTATSRVERWLHVFMTVGILYRAISTYSRGGFLAAGALGVMYIIRSPHKVKALVGGFVAAFIIYSVLPEAYWDRMRTIDPNQELAEGVLDTSAESRQHFWQVALTMAEDRPLIGVGVNAYVPAYDRYDFSNGRYGRQRSVHSIWLGCLAELGFTGIALFVLTLFLAISACWRARRLAKRKEIPPELAHFATAVESALIVCMVGGSFVLFFYVEMLWHVIGLSSAVHYLTVRHLAQNVPKVPERPVHSWGTKSPVGMTAAMGQGRSRGAIAT